MAEIFDVAVVGLGAMGSAAVYQLSQTGKRILGIDQFTPPHSSGSSHGDTRITREAIGEGRIYTPLVQLSNQIWDEIEQKTGRCLVTRCGGLIFGSQHIKTGRTGSGDFLGETIAAAKEFEIEHQILEHKELVQRYPQFKFHGNEIGYFESRAGFLRPERCIEVQLQLAALKGASILYNSRVLSIELRGSSGSVTLVTADGTYESEIVIISAGAWIGDFLPHVWDDSLKVYRQVLYWFEPELSIEAFSIERFGIYIRLGVHANDMFYGFPAIEGREGGVKLGRVIKLTR